MRPASNRDPTSLIRRLDEELTRLGAPPGAPLLLAVSGGSDSAALLHLLAAAGRRDLLVATVDHRLREGSSDDAALVAAWATSLKLPHRMLPWTTAAKGPALQERARSARYALLAACAEREGCAAVVTAHTADDQAETVFMRLRRGSGPSGLKGMAPQSRIACGAGAPTALLRPLLWARRTALRAFLESAGVTWRDDPSNDDPGFERIRVRALLSALEAQDILTVDALCETARRALIAEKARADVEAAVFRAAGGWFSRFGAAVLDFDAKVECAPGLAARLIQAASGEDHAPDDEAATAAFVDAARTGSATLGGGLLKRHGGALWICREPAAVLGRDGVAPLEPVRMEAGENYVWDGRFALFHRGDAAALVNPLGTEALVALKERRSLYDALDAALLTAPDVLFRECPVEAAALAEQRFFAPVRRFPEV